MIAYVSCGCGGYRSSKGDRTVIWTHDTDKSMGRFRMPPSSVPRRITWVWLSDCGYHSWMDVPEFGKRGNRESEPKRDRLASEPEICSRDAVYYAHDTLVELAR